MTDEAMPLTGEERTSVEQALALLPQALCVMTSAFDGGRAGVLVSRVMPCADEPLFVCVAARKGHSVAPLIRDAHAFGLCLIDESQRLLVRKFAPDAPEVEDPFDSLSSITLATGAPLLERSRAMLDCEVVRHFDLEADHELYVGQVLAGRVNGVI